MRNLCVMKKRWRATAVQDAGALADDPRTARSVLECGSPCIFFLSFLAGLQKPAKVVPPSRLQAGRRRRARDRAVLADLRVLRARARSASANCPELEPLPERFGLQPSRLVSMQV